MPDISLRFHKDMLVLSAPAAAVLSRQGIDVARDSEYLNLVEPEVIQEALRMQSLAGAQCLVTHSESFTPARLAHQGMEERLPELAGATLQVMKSLKPQHILVEIGPCGLPLDSSSAASLNENRQQYAHAARAFRDGQFDAFLLGSFTNAVDLKCALMGIAQVSDRPLFASVEVRGDGLLVDGRTSLQQAIATMEEFGASVVGITTKAPLEEACILAKSACELTYLPLLVQLKVETHAPKQGRTTPENPYYCPDTMVEAATRLRGVGAQFLRATGDATPAYSGALAAASEGFDVMRAVEGA